MEDLLPFFNLKWSSVKHSIITITSQLSLRRGLDYNKIYKLDI